MKRVVVDHYGGPEVLKVVEDDDPRPGPGEVLVRVLAAGVSFTDSQLRAGTYLGVPKPPFTPGYELVGVVEELGPGCSRLRVGDRIGALTVWGADAERVCVPEADAVEVPEDLDPAEVLSLLFPYMTAYQVLHRMAKVKSGETVLVHGAAGRVGIAALELGALAGASPLRNCFSSRPRRGRAARRGGDRLPAMRTSWRGCASYPEGCGRRARQRSVARLSLRSFRALRPGGRLVVFGAYSTLVDGHKRLAAVDQVVRVDRDRWAVGHALAPPAGVRVPHPEALRRRSSASVSFGRRARPVGGARATGSGSRRTSRCWWSCSARTRSTRSSPNACRSPRRATRTNCWRARRRLESSCSCPEPTDAR